MFIKDLQARQTGVEVEAEVVEVGDPREFNKMGKQGKVATAIIKDGTGTVKLSLWNEQVEQIKAGDKVKIEKGYVGEWQGELQLTTGKFGTLEVLGEGSSTDADPIKEDMNAEPVQPTPEAPTAEPVPKPEVPADEPKKEAPAEHSDLDVEEEEVM